MTKDAKPKEKAKNQAQGSNKQQAQGDKAKKDGKDASK